MYFYNNKNEKKEGSHSNNHKLNLQSQHFLKIIDFLIETDNLKNLESRMRENELQLIESVLSKNGKTEIENKDNKHRFELRLINNNDIIGLDDFVKYVFNPTYNKNSIVDEMEVIQTEINKSNLFSDLSFNKYIDIKSLYSCEAISSEVELCIIERAIFNKIIYMNQYLFYETYNSFVNKMNFLIKRIQSHVNKIFSNEKTRSKEMVIANKNLLITKNIKLGLEENEKVNIDLRPWSYDLNSKINESIKSLINNNQIKDKNHNDLNDSLNKKFNTKEKYDKKYHNNNNKLGLDISKQNSILNTEYNTLNNNNSNTTFLQRPNIQKSNLVIKLENLNKNENKSINFNSKIYLSNYIDMKNRFHTGSIDKDPITMDEIRRKNNSVNYDLEKQKHIDEKKLITDKIKDLKYKQFKLKKKSTATLELKSTIKRNIKNDTNFKTINCEFSDVNALKSISNLDVNNDMETILNSDRDLDSKSEMKINISKINLMNTLNSNNFKSITSRIDESYIKNNNIKKKIEKYKKVQDLKDKLFNLESVMNETENKNNNFLSTKSTFYTHDNKEKKLKSISFKKENHNKDKIDGVKLKQKLSFKSLNIENDIKSNDNSVNLSNKNKLKSNRSLKTINNKTNYSETFYNDKNCSKTIDFNNLIVTKNSVNSWETFENSKFVDIFTKKYYRNQYSNQNRIYNDLLNKNK